MKKLCSTWVLTLVILLCLAPATLLADGGNGGGGNGGGNNCGGGKGRHDDCHQVPEGGSGIIYLLAAGATCAGAIVIRSRQTKRNPA
jgi:hypothetical protein